jgi:hypothetical protein
MVMGLLSVGRGPLVARTALGLLVASVALASAQEEPESKKRLEFMQAEVGNLVPESSEVKSRAALTIGPKPLLRYSDPTRGGVESEDASNVLVDAGVWRLGTEGRPTALVTVEIYRERDGSRVVSFEFLSLTAARFSLKHKTEGVRWAATESGLDMKDLPDAPAPAATAAARLTQMRQLARRFAAKERFNKELIECRLVAQPIDRYPLEAGKVVDGAIFALANGTNPEFGILLESDGQRWRYGVLRLCSAEGSVTLDGQRVAAYEQFDARGRRDGAYNGGSYRIPTGK